MAPVASVFGRTGAVIAQSGDYTATEVGALPSTDDLSSIAAANATAANVSMSVHKLTNVANGTVATDAAAFGQTPAGGAISMYAHSIYAGLSDGADNDLDHNGRTIQCKCKYRELYGAAVGRCRDHCVICCRSKRVQYGVCLWLMRAW